MVDEFNDEEAQRGIYLFNLERGCWFPVPAMRNKVDDACMATCDDILYLFGGNANANSPNVYSQAYDHRTGEWRKLAKSIHEHEGAACCELGGKIYVCGGSSDWNVERYDSAADKWETLQSLNVPMIHHRLVPYAKRLWAMGSYIDNEPSCNLTIEIYNPQSNKWTLSSILREAAKKVTTHVFIQDAVVFKSS